jgi:transposase
LDKGTPPTSISEVLDVTLMTVYRIKRKFQKSGLQKALLEPSRPSHRKALDTRQAVSILAMACESPPQGRARWTVRLLTTEAMRRGIVKQISREPIRRLIHDGELKPWREKNVVRPEIDAFVRGPDGGDPGDL